MGRLELFPSAAPIKEYSNAGGGRSKAGLSGCQRRMLLPAMNYYGGFSFAQLIPCGGAIVLACPKASGQVACRGELAGDMVRRPFPGARAISELASTHSRRQR